jgi:hypothetical protein
MVFVDLKADTLDDENRKFVQQPLRHPLFLNSVPKSGTHLLRNIMRMFVPVEQQYKEQFVQQQILEKHRGAFNPDRKLLSWGHLMFTDASAVATAGVRQIILVRDPYDWVIASARFFVSEEFKSGIPALKDGSLTMGTLFNMMIFGVHQIAAPLGANFAFTAVAWMGTGAYLVRFEDLLAAVKNLDSEEADRFFADLLDACGIDRPGDWRERVRIGADPKQSSTARENLTVSIEFPKELPEVQKRLVDYAAPGLRALLGYE